MKRYAIILAGGVGSRAGAGGPKQFVKLGSKPIFIHSVEAFLKHDPDTEIVLVVHPDYVGSVASMIDSESIFVGRRPVIVPGGKSRPESVFNGLRAIARFGQENEEGVVAIHDAARPLVDAALIGRGFDSARRGFGSVPVVKAVNSLRRLFAEDSGEPLNSRRSESVDRTLYVEVQTPQIFYYNEILRAYSAQRELGGFTDDASLAEDSGMGIILYEGDPCNMKVTHPMDFAIASAIISARKGNV